MPNNDPILELATRAWREALEEKAHDFAAGVARRMAAAQPLQAAPPSQASPASARGQELRDGAVLIASSRTQTEILESLLAAASTLTPSCGLLILRGSQASGWGCAGLTSPENFKRATMDCTQGAVSVVLSSCAGRSAKAADLDQAFVAQIGLESAAEVLLLPVLLKERVAALLLALSGSPDDLAALEVLVQVTQLALDLQTYRKNAANSPAEAPRTMAAEAGQGTAMNFSAQSDAAGSGNSPARSQSRSAASSSEPNGHSPSGSAPGQPPSSDDAHERGRRFAKLLVEEIKLYNQAQVSEGRAHRDLYSRLREEIEKSRAAYQKRYGESVKDADYFTQELLRILADNDPALMGAGFPG
jgi:hypothetical protein